MRGAAIVYGDNNIINLHHQPDAEASQGPPKSPDQEEDIKEPLATILVVLTLACICGGAFYFVNRMSKTGADLSSTPQPAALSDNASSLSRKPANEVSSHSIRRKRTQSPILIGLAYGDNVTSNTVEGITSATCNDAGVKCVGEELISGGRISVPYEHGTDWSRIAVLISFLRDGETAHIIASTPSDAVGLDYADQRDGIFHNQLEFSVDFIQSISKTERPLWFPIDLIVRKKDAMFPLTITVTLDGKIEHSVTTNLQIATH